MSIALAITALVSTWLATATSHGDDLEVSVYSARHYDVDRQLYERFTEATGIRVNVVSGKSDELLARLEQEANLSPADLFITVDAGRLYRAEQRGVFQPHDSTTLNARVPDELRHPDDLWIGLTRRARVIVASVDRVEAGVRLSYEDLVRPEWRGRVVIRSSSNIYNQSLVASMIEHAGPEAAEDWSRGLVANLARKPQGGDRDQIRAVAAGEGDVAIVNQYYLAQMMLGSSADREAASQVRVIFPNQDGRGTHVNISGAGLTRHAPNRDNAVRLLEFLLSDEAQRTLAEGTQEYPVVPGVILSPILANWGPFKADLINASMLGANNPEAVRVMDRAGWR